MIAPRPGVPGRGRDGAGDSASTSRVTRPADTSPAPLCTSCNAVRVRLNRTERRRLARAGQAGVETMVLHDDACPTLVGPSAPGWQLAGQRRRFGGGAR